MSEKISLTNDIYYVGVNDNETNLFEALWPLPEGISYNSYLIDDDMVALIDTVSITYHDLFLEKIQEIIGDKSVDYLIINHMEPDHSGSIKALKRVYPDIKIVGNKKTMEFLKGFYGITKDLHIVNEGDCLDLGYHNLKFYLTPMVHWPETMMTIDIKDKILFSGDAFGGFGALDGGIFDDELNISNYENEIRRYYANIVGKYSPMVQKALNKLGDIDINIIAPTHGPVWREKPAHIIETYDKYSSYQADKGVVIIYGSMYGNTRKMAQIIGRTMAVEGIEDVHLFDASRTHLSFLLSAIWKYKGIVIGSCTYNNEVFPPVASLLDALSNRRIKNRLLGIFGSYSWSGGAVKGIKEFSKEIKFNLIEPVIEAQYSPHAEDLNECKHLAENMAQYLNNAGN